MLDDLKFIAQRDKSDAFGVVVKQNEMLGYSDFSLEGLPPEKPANIVVTGMGGSALSALICQKWWKDSLSVPLEIVRDYKLPGYVNDKTLVIASSYSGNTEEAVSALEDAISKGAKVVTVSSGGKLKDLANHNDLLHVPIPEGLQPRMAVFFGIKILASIFDRLGLTIGSVEELSSTADWLGEEAKKLYVDVGTSENQAKQIAQNIVGKTGVIYSGPALGPAAYKWKISLNESSKNLAWSNEFSEFNHNEIVGWTSHPVEKVFAVVELHSSLDNPRIAKRFEITNRVLSGRMPEPMIVNVPGNSHIAQLLWSVQLGDFVSLYLAMLNNVDPTPVDVIENLKKDLDK